MIYPIYSPAYGPYPPKTPENDLTVRRTGLPGGHDVVYDNGFLYVINSSENEHGCGTFRIYDVRGAYRDDPQPLGCLYGLGNTRQLEVRGSLAAVVCRETGLFLIDIRKKDAPFVICHYDTVELATGVAFHDRYLFVGCRNFGVEIIDIGDPSRPRHVSSIRAGEVQSVFVDNGILYTGSWGEHQVNVIDVRDALSPKKLAVIPLDGKGDGVFVKDGLLFAALGHHRTGCPINDPGHPGYGKGNGFQIFDVSDPASPRLLSETLFEHRFYSLFWDMWDIAVSGHYAVLSHTFNGVFIYDITDLRAPVLSGHIPLRTENAIDTDKPGSSVFDPKRNETLPRPLMFPFDPETFRCAPVTGAALADGRLYITSNFENLHIASSETFFRLPPEPKEVPLVSDAYDRDPGADTAGVLIRRTAGQVHGAAISQDFIAAACGESGIRLYTPDRLECAARSETDGFAMDIRAAGGLLFAACGMGGLRIYEQNGERLTLLGTWRQPPHSVMQAVPAPDGKHVIAHLDDRYVSIFNTADPSAPFEELREFYVPGLVYHRQLTANGAEGRYFGGFWNSNFTRWYDLSGETAVMLPGRQGKLNFGGGVTGLPDGHRSLAVTGGGYVIADIFSEDALYSDLPVISVPGVRLRGKPVYFEKEKLLIVSDRLDGNVCVIDASDLYAPRLLRHWVFSGHPELADCGGGMIVLPLGHEGIGRAYLRQL